MNGWDSIVKYVLDGETYEDRAMRYAEEIGIISYRVEDNTMVYYDTYEMERATYKRTIDLDTLTERVQAMSRYYKPYARIGKLEVNWR